MGYGCFHNTMAELGSGKRLQSVKLRYLLAFLEKICQPGSKMWSPDQQYWHLLEVCQKCRISDSTPRKLCFYNVPRWFWYKLKSEKLNCADETPTELAKMEMLIQWDWGGVQDAAALMSSQGGADTAGHTLNDKGLVCFPGILPQQSYRWCWPGLFYKGQGEFFLRKPIHRLLNEARV